MSLNIFLDHAKRGRISDVLVAVELCEEEPPPIWRPIAGGDIVIRFDVGDVLFRQPLGREQIVCELTTLEDWHRGIQQTFETSIIALTEVFDTCCYPLNRDSPAPHVTKVAAFSNNENQVVALLIELSTGGIFGIEALSFEGLRWFLDARLFRESLTGYPLHELDVWNRTPG